MSKLNHKEILIFFKKCVVCQSEFKVRESKSNIKTCSPKCKQILIAFKFLMKFFIEAPKIHNNRYGYGLIDINDIILRYNGRKTTVPIYCPRHGEFQQTLGNHLLGRGCYKCNAIDKTRLKYEYFLEKSKEIHGSTFNLDLITENWWIKNYQNASTKIPVVCQEHGPFKIRVKDFLNAKQGCGKCGIKKTTLKNRYTFEEIRLKLNDCELINIDIKYYTEEYHAKNYRKLDDFRIPLNCPIHGVVESGILSGLFTRKAIYCPLCTSSIGESKIASWLDINDIHYVRQYRFENTRFFFDFFIPSENLVIEFDGEQHFRPIDFFGGKKEYIKTRLRDMKKNRLCRELGIKLLRISYEELTQISKILEYRKYNGIR